MYVARKGMKMARYCFRIIVFLMIFIVSSISFAEEDKFGSIINLQKIIVTPSRTNSVIGDVPTDASIIDSETIESENPVNIDDTLKYIPGVDVSRRSGFTSATSNVTLRGFGTQSRGRTLVLIDGIPFNEIYSGEVYWNAINPKDVERVEVVPGVSSIYGPGAMGGVINIITRKPEKLENEVDLSYGSYATRAFYVRHAFKYKNFSYLVSGNGYKTNGYVAVPDRQPYDIRRWRENYGANVKLMYDFDETSSIGVNYQYYDENVNGGRKYYYGTKDLNNLNFDLKKSFSDILELSGTTYFSWENNWWTYDTPSTGTMANRYTRVDYTNNNPKSGWGGNAQALIKYPDFNKFWIGMDWNWGKIQSKDEYKSAVRWVESKGSQEKVGMYIQDEVTLFDKLMVYLGGRMDYWKNSDGFLSDNNLTPRNRTFDPKSGIEFSPKVGAVYHITNDTSVRVSIGKAFRVPTLYDLYRTWRSSTTTYNSNPNLSPEETYTYEAGIDHTFFDKLLLRNTFYFNDVKNLIYSVDTAVASVKSKDNIGRVHIYGLETEARYELNKNFSIFCNYTLNLSRIYKHTNQNLKNKYLTYTPKNKMSYGTSLHIPKLVDIDLFGRYNGLMFNDDLNTQKLKDIFTFDLSVAKEITKNFKVSVKIENLFDRTYQEYRGVLAPPRTAIVEGKIIF